MKAPMYVPSVEIQKLWSNLESAAKGYSPDGKMVAASRQDLLAFINAYKNLYDNYRIAAIDRDGSFARLEEAERTIKSYDQRILMFNKITFTPTPPASDMSEKEMKAAQLSHTVKRLADGAGGFGPASDYAPFSKGDINYVIDSLIDSAMEKADLIMQLDEARDTLNKAEKNSIRHAEEVQSLNDEIRELGDEINRLRSSGGLKDLVREVLAEQKRLEKDEEEKREGRPLRYAFHGVARPEEPLFDDVVFIEEKEEPKRKECEPLCVIGGLVTAVIMGALAYGVYLIG